MKFHALRVPVLVSGVYPEYRFLSSGPFATLRKRSESPLISLDEDTSAELHPLIPQSSLPLAERPKRHFDKRQGAQITYKLQLIRKPFASSAYGPASPAPCCLSFLFVIPSEAEEPASLPETSPATTAPLFGAPTYCALAVTTAPCARIHASAATTCGKPASAPFQAVSIRS